MESPVLAAEDLRRTYDDRVVVEGFSVTIRPGETVVLVGPNGCGKTTSSEMCLGLRRPDSGRAAICGHDVHHAGNEASRSVGVALQGASLNARVRVREHLEFFAALYGRQGGALQIAEQLGLDARVLGSLYGSLSGGQQRRVLVAAALAGEPPLAVLDEPTSGVDIESRISMWYALRSVQAHTGTSYLITTHDLQEAEQWGDRVLVMREGVLLFDGTPASFVAASGLLLVCTVRAQNEVDREFFQHPEVAELRVTPREIVLGLRRGSDIEDLRSWAGPRRSMGVSLAERTPTFEDAYLAFYGAHEGKPDLDGAVQ